MKAHAKSRREAEGFFASEMVKQTHPHGIFPIYIYILIPFCLTPLWPLWLPDSPLLCRCYNTYDVKGGRQWRDTCGEFTEWVDKKHADLLLAEE